MAARKTALFFRKIESKKLFNIHWNIYWDNNCRALTGIEKRNSRASSKHRTGWKNGNYENSAVSTACEIGRKKRVDRRIVEDCAHCTSRMHVCTVGGVHARIYMFVRGRRPVAGSPHGRLIGLLDRDVQPLPLYYYHCRSSTYYTNTLSRRFAGMYEGLLLLTDQIVHTSALAPPSTQQQAYHSSLLFFRVLSCPRDSLAILP